VSAYFGNYLDPDDDPARFDCFQEAESPQFVYSSMALDQRLTETRIGSPYEIGENDAFRLSGQFALRRQLSDVVADPAGLSGGVMRGVAYVLGRRSDHDLMPKKRHEWFVPYADDWEERLAKARPDGQSTLRVRPDTIATFERIAAERDAANKEDTPRDYRRPFLPKGYRSRHPIRADGRGGFLHSGDLVYFDVDNSGQEVTEISFSAIWRDSIGGHLYGSFSRTATPDVLPWHRRDPDDDRRPGRDALTPAECLFGVVDDLPRVRRVGDAARNLASRVRFSDARGLAAPALFYPEDQPLPYLRQLQSPKPPSPAMYFRTRNDGAVNKHSLDLTTQVPNGRKHYLPHPPDDALNGRPWETRKLAGVAPSDMALILPGYIKDGGHYGNPLADRQELWFHVDFENLSQAELDLLCTAIDPNTSRLSPENAPDFHHRLGWGRPLGLGIVRIEIAGIFLIARPVRYSSKGLDGPRYQGRWLSQSANDTLLRSRYPDELTEPCNLKLPEPLKVAAELIDLEALEVLLRLGDVDAIDGPVCYPYTAQQSPASEEEGFKWFVDNDHHPDTDYQFLEPVNGPDGILPALKAR
jgi:hypothetical protein